MQELQKLYDEVASSFDKLFTKRKEVSQRIESLKEEMKEAEADYDISKLEQLTTSLSSAERIHTRIEMDIDKLKLKVNGVNGNKLSYKVEDIRLSALMGYNRSDRIQNQFKKVAALKQEIEEIEKSLKDQAEKDTAKVNELRNKFRAFYPRDLHVPATPQYEYHAVEK